MRTRFAVVVAGLLVLGAGRAQAITLDELIAKHIEARGGLANLRALKSVRATGHVRFGGGNFTVDVDYAQLRARPSLYRDEGTLQGLTQINAWDGKEGWAVSPFQGRKDPQHSSTDDSKNLEQQADLDGPLVDAEEKGNKIELLGKDEAEGRPAWKLKVTRKNGDERIVYIDAETYLQTVTITRRTVGGREIEIKSIIDDYRSVDGLELPHSFDAAAPGMPQGQSMRFRKAEINVPIDDSRFKKPSLQPTPAPTRRPERQTTPSNTR